MTLRKRKMRTCRRYGRNVSMPAKPMQTSIRVCISTGLVERAEMPGMRAKTMGMEQAVVPHLGKKRLKNPDVRQTRKPPTAILSPCSTATHSRRIRPEKATHAMESIRMIFQSRLFGRMHRRMVPIPSLLESTAEISPQASVPDPAEPWKTGKRP